MRHVLASLGNPHLGRRWVLVAGTNGKGSVCATVEAILLAYGRRTFLYTSPHLVTIEERWRIAGEDVSPERLDQAIERLHEASLKAGLTPTYFEALTLVAFILAEEAESEIGILEVGMGGRLDATNVADAREAAIVSIGLDHTEWLGETLAEIAREKAGIIRSGARVVSGVRDPEAREIIEKVAEGSDATLLTIDEDFAAEVVRMAGEGQIVKLSLSGRKIDVETPMQGVHQADNLAVASMLAYAILDFPPVERFARALTRGVGGVRWRGRYERFAIAGKRVIVDGAHNLNGVAALVETLRSLSEATSICFGALVDKEWRGMVDQLLPLAERWYLAPVASDRAANPADLARYIEQRGGSATVCATVGDALRAAADADPPRVVVCGSLYLVGDAIAILDRW